VAIRSVTLQANDDALTVCAISLLAAILSDLLHEGLGHAATALLTGTKSGLLTTVAWSSDFDSATQGEKRVSSMVFFSADKFRVQPF